MLKKSKKNAHSFRQMKDSQESYSKLVCVTAYDYTFAKLVDQAEVDIVLVGDSLGMVVQGHSNTLSVTLEQMIYHTQCVARGIEQAHLCVDMPFMSYQVSSRDALRNAGRLVSEGKAHSVKLEGGVSIAKTVEKIVSSGIPVLGHVGLTPQSVHQLGGYKIQGKTVSSREALLQDALALEDSGAFALVLEGIPTELAQVITERLKIPTIGIGAGPHCDGQVLVLQDLLGLNPDFKPKFVKAYSQLGEQVTNAIQQFATEVKASRFPTIDHSFYAGS
ncbi:MAG: 3-methyl-2-oxobutanoate hydroxymethyltransferase [Pseudomonadota bacterium]